MKYKKVLYLQNPDKNDFRDYSIRTVLTLFQLTQEILSYMYLQILLKYYYVYRVNYNDKTVNAAR